MERANISSILESVAALTVTHTLRGQEPPDLSCVLNALVMQSLLGKLRIAARRANHTAPLVALSHAVLVRIFEGLELADRLSVSQTCHDLREVALRAPSLWSRLTYHEDRNCCYQCYDPDPNYRHRHSYPRSCNGQLLGAMLRRSEPELVNFNLSLDVGPHEFGMLPHILETTLLPRAASLWLTLFHWGRRTHYLNWEETHLWIDTVHRDPLSNNDWRPYAATFKSAAPFLRTLSLRSPYSYSSSIPFAPEIPYDFLGGEPRRLEACRISGFSLPVIGCPAFASLTVFEYASPSSIVASFLQDILAQMPVLLTLGLTLDSFADDTGDHGMISTFGIRNVGLGFNRIEADEYHMGMLDSDHHHDGPPGRTTPTAGGNGHRGTRILAPTQTGAAHRAALDATTALDERTLRSVKSCCQVVHDVALMAPSHTIYEYHEDHLLQLASDVHALGQWVQTLLLAFRAARRATSSAPAPAPAPAAVPAPAPAQPPLVSMLAASPTPSPAPEVPAGPPKAVGTTLSSPAPCTTLKSRNRPRKRTPRPPDAPTSITFRYFGTLRDRKRPHPKYIIDTLKVIPGVSLAAVSYTRDHQIVLYPQAPCTVQNLIDKRMAIHDLLIAFFSPADKPPPTFDPGLPWTRLVIQHAPLPYYPPFKARWHGEEPGPPPPVMRRLGDLANDLCASNGIDRNSLHDMRPLCPLEKREELFLSSEKWDPQHCSLVICLSDPEAASRLLKLGATVQNARCRVTLYRPRPPKRRQSTAPHL